MLEHLQILDAVAGLFAMLRRGLRWLAQGVRRTHHPELPVSARGLRYRDVERGFDMLVAEAREFCPQAVYGINRGGLIVGGVLAKQLGLPSVHHVQVEIRGHAEHIDIHPCRDRVPDPDRIILVDDAVRTRAHMGAATQELRRLYPNAELQRYVMLEVRTAPVGPDADTRPRVPVERAAFHAHDQRARLPWDLPVR